VNKIRNIEEKVKKNAGENTKKDKEIYKQEVKKDKKVEKN